MGTMFDEHARAISSLASVYGAVLELHIGSTASITWRGFRGYSATGELAPVEAAQNILEAIVVHNNKAPYWNARHIPFVLGLMKCHKNMADGVERYPDLLRSMDAVNRDTFVFLKLLGERFQGVELRWDRLGNGKFIAVWSGFSSGRSDTPEEALLQVAIRVGASNPGLARDMLTFANKPTNYRENGK